MSADPKFVHDDDPSAYKSHVLYILPGDANCEHLLRMIETTPLYDEVYIQDVKLLKQRPHWLDGVPILVVKKTSQAHKGRNIMQYVQQWQNDDLIPVDVGAGNKSQFTGDYASFHNAGMYTLEDENDAAPVHSEVDSNGQPQYNERQLRKKQAETENSSKLQQMIEARNQMDARVSQHGQRGPVPRNVMAQGRW